MNQDSNRYTQPLRKNIKTDSGRGLDVFLPPKVETKKSQNKSERHSKKKSAKGQIDPSSYERAFEEMDKKINLSASYQDSVITIASEILVEDLPEFIVNIHSDQAKNTRKRIADKFFDYLSLEEGIQLPKDTGSSISIYNALLNTEIRDHYLKVQYAEANKRTKMLFQGVLEKKITCEKLVCHFFEFLAEGNLKFIKNKPSSTIKEVEILCEMMGILLQSAGSVLYKTIKNLNSNKATPVRIASLKILKMCQTQVIFSLTTDCDESNKELVNLLNKAIDETHEESFEDQYKHSGYISALRESNEMGTNEYNFGLQMRNSNGFKEHNGSFNDLNIEERKQQDCPDNGLSVDNRRKVESSVMYNYFDGQNGFNNSNDNFLHRLSLSFDNYGQKAIDNQSNLEEDDSENLKNNYNDTENKNNKYFNNNFEQIKYQKKDFYYEGEHGYGWNSLNELQDPNIYRGETTNDNKNDMTDKHSSLIFELTNKTKEAMQENDYIEKENDYIKKEYDYIKKEYDLNQERIRLNQERIQLYQEKIQLYQEKIRLSQEGNIRDERNFEDHNKDQRHVPSNYRSC